MPKPGQKHECGSEDQVGLGETAPGTTTRVAAALSLRVDAQRYGSLSCYQSILLIDKDRYFCYPPAMQITSSGVVAWFALRLCGLALLGVFRKQRKTAREQPVFSLFFRSHNRRRPRFSAENEISLVDNSGKNSEKQRAAPGFRRRSPPRCGPENAFEPGLRRCRRSRGIAGR